MIDVLCAVCCVQILRSFVYLVQRWLEFVARSRSPDQESILRAPENRISADLTTAYTLLHTVGANVEGEGVSQVGVMLC